VLHLVYAAATSADALGSLVNYGAIGVFAVILIYVVRALDARNVKNFDARLAEKDRIIADKDAQIAKKDTTIDMLLRQGQSTIPALERAAEVMEILPQKAPPSDDLAEIKKVLPRLNEVLSRLEGK
jgi:hypothetical protein